MNKLDLRKGAKLVQENLVMQSTTITDSKTEIICSKKEIILIDAE